MNNLDNTTAHTSVTYDSQIRNTIPYYDCFHKETINFIRSAKSNPKIWLDTGCGTGTLAEQAIKYFNDTLFILSDPSIGMINKAKDKFANMSNDKVEFLEPAPTQEIKLNNGERADVITAIQSHHYLSSEYRIKATAKCYELLQRDGIYITFENICPMTKQGIEIGKEYWKQFQIDSGKEKLEAENHIKRFGIEYFPITIEEHINLLRSVGFKAVEMFWYSYLQAGFYCIK
jgi:tRNA (cmo5U34)-methyltransferase